MNYNQNSWYGQALLAMVQNQVGVLWNIMVVMNSTDTDEKNYQRTSELLTPDTEGNVRFFTSLWDAYDACESNNNDVILLDSNSTHSLSAWIAWSKNRINVIWMDWWDRLVQQWSKVQLVTAATTTYVIKVTWVRNSFRNIKFIQSATAWTWLTVLQEWGEWTLYKNCSFVFWVADNLDQTDAYEVIAGSDSATYLNCTFGSDTLTTSAARTIFRLAVVTAWQEFKSNILKDCTFLVQSSSNAVKFVSWAATSSIKFTNIFKDCTFAATINATASAIALTSAVTTPNGLVEWGIYFEYPRCFNVTDFGTNGTNNDNIQIVAPASVAAAVEWIAPTA